MSSRSDLIKIATILSGAPVFNGSMRIRVSVSLIYFSVLKSLKSFWFRGRSSP